MEKFGEMPAIKPKIKQQIERISSLSDQRVNQELNKIHQRHEQQAVKNSASAVEEKLLEYGHNSLEEMNPEERRGILAQILLGENYQDYLAYSRTRAEQEQAENMNKMAGQ